MSNANQLKVDDQADKSKVPFYLQYLHSELKLRQERNPRYTMSAFAKHLNLSVATFSRILDQKRTPSLETIELIAERLALKSSDRRAFVRSSAESLVCRDIDSMSIPPEVREIDEDEFCVISDWCHYAILELTYVDGFQSNAKWIAKKLGIDIDAANIALNRLLRLNLLIEKKDGNGNLRYFKSGEKLTTKDKLKTSEFHRKFQNQILARAMESLAKDPIEQRSMTSLTVAIAPEQLAVARAMIQEFTRNLCDVLESGQQKRVYHMSLALYPADQEVENEE